MSRRYVDSRNRNQCAGLSDFPTDPRLLTARQNAAPNIQIVPPSMFKSRQQYPNYANLIEMIATGVGWRNRNKSVSAGA